jgi:hypothetical protein
MNFSRINGSIDVARAMQARDWKGFGTGFQLQNGVITLGSGGAVAVATVSLSDHPSTGIIKIANCITAREDRGISALRQQGSALIVLCRKQKK